jgi:hypothetical protein
MIEFEINGVKRGFKLGPYTFKLINQVSDTKTIDDVLKKMKDESQDFAFILYFCCAKHWAMINKLPIDFEEVHVAEWIEELGSDRMKEITEELFKTFMAKNVKAPMTGQELPLSNGKL